MAVKKGAVAVGGGGKPGLATRGGTALTTLWRRMVTLAVHLVVGAVLGVCLVFVVTLLSRSAGDTVRFAALFIERSIRLWPELAIGALGGGFLGLVWLAAKRL